MLQVMTRKAFVLGLVLFFFLILGGLFYLNQQKSTKQKQVTLSPEMQKQFEEVKVTSAEMQKIAAAKRQYTIPLAIENNSGEAGLAILSETNGKATVSIAMTFGFPNDKEQPAHIHIGSCPGINAIKYQLNGIKNGKSETTLAISLDQLLKELPLAINIHKSETAITEYVSCGNIIPQSKP